MLHISLLPYFTVVTVESAVIEWNCVSECRRVILFVLHRFFELFEKYGGYKSGKLKLKKPKQLQVRESDGSFSFSHSACLFLFSFCMLWLKNSEDFPTMQQQVHILRSMVVTVDHLTSSCWQNTWLYTWLSTVNALMSLGTWFSFYKTLFKVPQPQFFRHVIMDVYHKTVTSSPVHMTSWLQTKWLLMEEDWT